MRYMLKPSSPYPDPTAYWWVKRSSRYILIVDRLLTVCSDLSNGNIDEHGQNFEDPRKTPHLLDVVDTTFSNTHPEQRNVHRIKILCIPKNFGIILSSRSSVE